MVAESERNLKLLYEFEVYHQNELRPRTMAIYLEHLTKFLRLCDPVTITRREIVQVFNEHFSSGQGSTKNIKRSAIRKFMNWLVEMEYRDDDPSIALPKIKLASRAPKVIEKDLIAAALTKYSETPSEHRDITMIVLMADCGLRVSEVIGLRLEDILATEELRIIGKGNKERFVPLSKRAIEYLDEWLGMRWMFKPGDSPYVFLTRNGGQVQVRRIAEELQNRGNTHPHALRTFFATKLANAGVDINVIRELLGHASISTTQKYIDVAQNRVKQEYKRVMN